MTSGGQQFGKYRILAELGVGGFATVYKAVDTTLDREVALKILHPPLLTDRRFVQNFRQEAKTLAALRHPQIITVYEVGEVDGRLFIAMDLAHGLSLAQSIAKRGRIPWDETLALLKPVCDALDYAHGQKVIHRDLKPANLLLDTQRGALLTDFGFARLMAENSASMSMSGGIVGTPGYIAPEVWEENAASPPVDIYALGCMVYEMLTGDVLFKGQTPIQAMRAHDRGPQYPATWPEGVPAGITEVLNKALAHDPAARYASAGALWYALNDLEAQVQSAHEAAQRAALAAQWRAEAERALAAKEWDAARMAIGRWRATAPNDPATSAAQAVLDRSAIEQFSPKPTSTSPRTNIANPEKSAQSTPTVATAPAALPQSKSIWKRLGFAFIACSIIGFLIVLLLTNRTPLDRTGTAATSAPAPTSMASTAASEPTSSLVPTTETSTATPSLGSTAESTPAPTAAGVVTAPAATRISDSTEKQHLEFGMVSQLYDTDRERILGLNSTAGFDWVKQQVAWKDIEDSPGHYNWNQLDLIVNDTAQHNLKLLFTIAHAPTFYTPDGQSGLPQDPKALGDFVEALVKRYGEKIQAYEIWEEQNLAVNNGGRVTVEDAGHYVDILVECFNRIKAINPNITVVAGAVASTAADDPSVAVSDENYYQAMYRYKNGIIKDHFDVQAVRPYGSANPPETMWPDTPSNADGWTNDPTFYFRRVEDIRTIMEEEGLQNHQIWITGFGWATKNNTPGYEYGNQVSFEQQRDYIIGAIQLVYQKYHNSDGTPWVGVMFLWNMNFAVLWEQRGNPEHQESSFGILNTDWTPRPAFVGLQELLPQIKQAQGR